MTLLSDGFYQFCLDHHADVAPLPFVVPNSIPIPFFGDIRRYVSSKIKVLTAALNPSLREFPEGVSRFDVKEARAGPDGLERELSRYFERRPYVTWFSSFEPVLNGLGCSYGGHMASDYWANTALHIDMCSPIATSPTWSRLALGDRAPLSPTGRLIFEQAIDQLEPDIVIASLAWAHIAHWHEDFAAGSTWETHLSYSTSAAGNALRNSLKVQARWLRSINGHRYLFVNASAANTPFGRFTNGRKREVGESLVQCLSADATSQPVDPLAYLLTSERWLRTSTAAKPTASAAVLDLGVVEAPHGGGAHEALNRGLIDLAIVVVGLLETDHQIGRFSAIADPSDQRAPIDILTIEGCYRDARSILGAKFLGSRWLSKGSERDHREQSDHQRLELLYELDPGVLHLDRDLRKREIENEPEDQMRTTLRTIVGGMLVMVAATAPASAYVSSAGHEYELQCSRDGYELKSSYPVARMVGIGANSRWVSERESIYLGRSCDAQLKTYGYGEQCSANGGFLVTFGENRIGLPRQELWCEVWQDYEGDCGC